MMKNIAQKDLDMYMPECVEEQGYLQAMKAFLKEQDIFAYRSNLLGHFTGSAWVINSWLTHTLLIHHKKLNSWFQPGGHIEECDMSFRDTSVREAREELGIDTFKFISDNIFDIDIHYIPEKHTEPEHIHYDVRYLIIIDDNDTMQLDNLEIYGAKWVSIDYLLASSPLSLQRMARKTQFLQLS